jgi:hypothetical protein
MFHLIFSHHVLSDDYSRVVSIVAQIPRHALLIDLANIQAENAFAGPAPESGRDFCDDLQILSTLSFSFFVSPGLQLSLLLFVHSAVFFCFSWSTTLTSAVCSLSGLRTTGGPETAPSRHPPHLLCEIDKAKSIKMNALNCEFCVASYPCGPAESIVILSVVYTVNSGAFTRKQFYS